MQTAPSDLGAVCMHEQWAEVNARLCEMINEHRSTLIFVNNRRMAERVTHQLTQLLGEEAVSSHHGSLAAKLRHDTEQRLKTGKLKAVVATASLELGLDIGYIDLVVQLGSPRAIATFLQRVGRSGHALGLTPKGRMFALTRDELIEGMALMRAIDGGRLDRILIPTAPLDILAQQIVAEVSGREWNSDELFALCRRAYPYRNLPRSEFDRVVQMLSEGVSNSAGRGKVFVHHDLVGRRLRARPGSRIIAATNGGAIPEIASYRVVAEPEHTVVGSLDEDFASESQAGEIFLLGNTSWRIKHVRGNDVTVTDAHGAPPSIPFWRGEAPGRTFELSEEVSKLREEIERRLDDPDVESWLAAETHTGSFAAQQAVNYCRAEKAAIGLLPTQKRIVFERFFDESGGMQMVVHAPFGAAINKAWGLAMRKRFCRSFDFELQATADDDGFILSLGPQHSFPLESMFHMLNPQNARALLEQALLFVPTFQTRWRWNITRALFVERQRNGKKVPPALQRFRADDLLTAVFPKLTGCQENIVGDHELPDHPLVNQSMHDSLHEAHDLDGLMRVLQQIERGEIELVARDTREPSPFSYELLNANPYAFLDGGEIAERRTRAVATRRSLTVESVSDLGRLDPEAIARVVAEAQPLVRNADELHDVLLSRIATGPVCRTGPAEWPSLFAELVAHGRAAMVKRPGQRDLWAATERLPAVLAAFPDATIEPPTDIPAEVRRDWTAEEARVAMVRGLVEVCGPTTAAAVADQLGITSSEADAALEALEGEGVVLRGRFTPEDVPWGKFPNLPVSLPASDAACIPDTPSASSPDAPNADRASWATCPTEIEWCHRRLLARIHRLTMEGLRKQIEPVPVEIYLRFLARHHGLLAGSQRAAANGLFEVISMLEGIDLPAVVWERDVLPARLEKYRPEWLDELCLAGEVGWGRLFPTKRTPDRSRPMASLTRVVPMSLFLREDAPWLQTKVATCDLSTLSSPGQQVYRLLRDRGASFAADLAADTRMLPAQLNDVLGELVAAGLVTADGFAGLRALLAARSPETEPRIRLRIAPRRAPLAGSGRWSLWRRDSAGEPDIDAGSTSTDSSAAPRIDPPPLASSRVPDTSAAEHFAWLLLRRWGVVFRDLLEREPGAPPWWELLQVYRRLEARGEIRGGRFIIGVAGEQFAIGETVRLLRQIRDEGPKQELVVIAAADPLNLAGILTPHERVTANSTNRVAYLDGVPIAALVAGEVRYFVEPTAAIRKLLRDGKALSRRKTDDDTPDPGKSNESSSGENRAPAETPRTKRRDQKSLFPSRIPRPFFG
jgi:ATP-dependent helicase Lhr and Lhr-like helicase